METPRIQMNNYNKSGLYTLFNHGPSYFRLNICLLVMLVCIAQPVHARKPPTLVLNNAFAPPYTNATHDGFLDIIVSEALRRLGVNLKLIKLPPERALINVNAGLDDGELSRIAGLEKLYPNLMRVPEKLLDFEFAAFSKDPNIPADWGSIRQYSVGHIRGWKFYEHHMKGAGVMLTATSPRQLFQLLDRDRIKIALYARWMGQAQLRQMGIRGVYQLKPILAKREMFIYLNKRHARLVPRIDQALKDLKQEGFYKRIAEEKLFPYAKGPL